MMGHIPPNMHPQALQNPLRDCAAKATKILKSTEGDAVLSPEAATAAIGELASLVVTLAQSVTACARAADSAERTASSARGRRGFPTW